MPSVLTYGSLFLAMNFWGLFGGSKTQKPAAPAAPSPAAKATPASPNESLRILMPVGQNFPCVGENMAEFWGEANGRAQILYYPDDATAIKAVLDGACDLAALSDRAAAALIAQKALQPLPALAPPAPAPEFSRHYYDPAGLYTWPYGWSLLGWAAVPDKAAPRAWRDLTNPGLSLSLPADPALRAALWALAQDKPPAEGGPLPQAWKDAHESADAGVRVDFLWKLRGHLRGKEELVLPPGGSLITLYQWTVPVASRQPARVARVLSFLADPPTAAALDQTWGLAATQADAHILFPPYLQVDPTLYPLPPERNLCRFVR